MLIRPGSTRSDRPQGYYQALDDFGITELLTQLGNYSDTDFNTAQTNPTQPELESLAAILIQQLTANLNGKAITDYLKVMRRGSANIPPALVHLAVPPPSQDLPANFPNVGTPRYLYGDQLRWICDDDNTDWGVVSGRFYSFAPHYCAWTWCYLIWLDKLSPSATRIAADIAWEDDLEPIVEEKTS